MSCQKSFTLSISGCPDWDTLLEWGSPILNHSLNGSASFSPDSASGGTVVASVQNGAFASGSMQATNGTTFLWSGGAITANIHGVFASDVALPFDCSFIVICIINGVTTVNYSQPISGTYDVTASIPDGTTSAKTVQFVVGLLGTGQSNKSASLTATFSCV